ncbi:MAG: S41 family peptidase [Planctomyces sp.]|nr:S41 family peptidase [Planctomyces sp.]
MFNASKLLVTTIAIVSTILSALAVRDRSLHEPASAMETRSPYYEAASINGASPVRVSRSAVRQPVEIRQVSSSYGSRIQTAKHSVVTATVSRIEHNTAEFTSAELTHAESGHAEVNQPEFNGTRSGNLHRIGEAPYADQRVLREIHDPFIPVPLPRTMWAFATSDEFAQVRIGTPVDDGPMIDRSITLRYSDPINLRAIRAIDRDHAERLFMEVSRRIDERSLRPTSYDVRVRRGLRNLTIALDNPKFAEQFFSKETTFRIDAFRNSLSRTADAMVCRDFSDAEQMLSRVIDDASRAGVLSPGVIGVEFSAASLDTLDEYSGLDLAEPEPGTGESFEIRMTGVLDEEITGIGVEVREHPEGMVIVRTLRDGPAREAGIEPGDIVTQIGRQPIAGMTLAQIVDLMHGPAGSRLEIEITRPGSESKKMTLIRRRIRMWTVNDARLLNGTQTAYFSLSRFSQSTVDEIDETLIDLHAQGMTSLIIDLRGNPGGLLSTCVEVCDRFIACGTIVSTRGRLSSDNMTEDATYPRTWKVPLVVLIDEHSASASEIFAAAIQENLRGLIVGNRSYGKGAVQTHFQLESVPGSLRLTTALFYSPNGHKMAGRGVLPDSLISDDDGVQNGDRVLDEAIRLVKSSSVAEMARASGLCQSYQKSPGRSSLLREIVDPHHSGTTIF